MDEVTEVRKSVEDYINDVQQHVSISKAVLFGSYAKGNHNKDSDVDLAIFSKNFRQMTSVEVNSFLFSLARKYKNVCIEPIGFDEEHLHMDNPFVKEILSTGKELPTT